MTESNQITATEDTIRISALIKQLSDLCSKNDIPLMIALQDLTSDGKKCIRLVADESNPVSPQMKLIKTLIQHSDIDGFLKSLMLDAKKNGHRSIVLRAMGIPEEPKF